MPLWDNRGKKFERKLFWSIRCINLAKKCKRMWYKTGKDREKITGSLKRQGILKFRYRLLKTSETDHRMFVVNFSIRFLTETSKNNNSNRWKEMPIQSCVLNQSLLFYLCCRILSFPQALCNNCFKCSVRLLNRTGKCNSFNVVRSFWKLQKNEGMWLSDFCHLKICFIVVH